jgi:hypothetical protein
MRASQRRRRAFRPRGGIVATVPKKNKTKSGKKRFSQRREDAKEYSKERRRSLLSFSLLSAFAPWRLCESLFSLP